MADHVDKKPRISEDLCINTIRMLSADQPTAGKSGHPGAPMGCAPMAHVLFGKIMKFNPKNPKWSNRDRFVLSNGHACALQYSMLHLTGYDLPLDELKKFRQWGSKAPGHPENFCTSGVEVSTGPLGQGISNAVGLAMAEKHLAAEFNKDGLNIVDHYTYVICGDGCLQEGVSSETSSLAGHLGLGKLIVLYDDNKITIDGHTDISFTEDVMKRYEAYGWHVQYIEDGNYDHAAIHHAIETAKGVTDKPSLIKIHTTIGLGSKLENTHSVHGAPLKPEDLSAAKERFGFSGSDSFFVPEQVKKYYDKTVVGAQHEQKWNDLIATYANKYPKDAAEFTRRMEGKLPADWKSKMPKYTPEDATKATRQYSEIALNAIATALPEIVGGSADLTPSNLTHLSMSGDFQKNTPIGRYIRYGVREHGMAAISNGLFAHGGVRPFCATFYNFIGYALGAVRLSALSRFGVIYIATHDSIFLGEDGPTHQPIEMSASLRAMPNMYVYRPADGNETMGAYIAAVENQHKTSVLALSRQGLPNLANSTAEAVVQGGYIIANVAHGKEVAELEGEPDLILVATGSEVSLSIDAAKLLDGYKTRIVSMPCRDLFDEQSIEYKKEILGEGIPVMSVEAAATFGWATYSHSHFGLDRFGASATIAQLQDHFGFNPNTVADEARKLVKFYGGRSAPNLFDHPAQRVLKALDH
ncbi:transketolase [Plasmopara halstedii]|uniref:Transketolase n=1 Tax=Plasmopara halstedii TaxID=4781 RepID=A0A0N7L703_PLAHL|nr:transketolase [Plasmopara halstedii]CEG45715.1 transketolase [Plasmopara halstedii]|eukprot:XP_024582084.1 transketolase [Plasmopara halstedii]